MDNATHFKNEKVLSLLQDKGIHTYLVVTIEVSGVRAATEWSIQTVKQIGTFQSI